MIPFLLVVVVIALAVGATAAPPAKPRRLEPEPEDAVTLVDRDPIEALRIYGTPETADQLRAQGVDLAALGYQEGGES